MDIVQHVEEQPALNQLYIKSIILSFSLLQSNLSYKCLGPYLKFLEGRPLTKINIVGENKNNGIYNKVGVGGTFDRLHIGHQILLIMTVILSKNQVYIGVVSDKLLQKKKNNPLIQPCHLRINKIKEYISKIVPKQNQLKITVQQINDGFGPTIIDQGFDALVVSEQTIKGGQKINEIRKEKGMSDLHIQICPALNPESQKSNIEKKTSSSSLRQYIINKNNMSQQDFINYQKEWKTLIKNLCQILEQNYNQEIAQKWFFTILDFYSQYWRYYHTNYHINTMLKEFHTHQYQLSLEEEIMILLSIWFHDIHYVPSDSQNQEKSANIYEQFIQELMPETQSEKKNIFIKNVKKAIISTKHHKPQNKVQQILIDLDMAILDSPLQEYKIYAKLIQQEYKPLVKEKYNQKRIEFLSTIQPDSVFTIRKPLNIQTNIKWEIDSLKESQQL